MKSSYKTNGVLKAAVSAKLAVLAAIVIPLVLLGMVRCRGFRAENSVDAYYHVALADLGPKYYTARKIPQLTMSVWKDRFSDKELGYHLLLTAVRGSARNVGLSETPPFNLDALFFDFLLLTAFVFACAAFGTRPRDLVFLSTALVVATPFFTDRLLMLRPHNLSIALMITACAVFHKLRGSRALSIAAVALGLVSAWCYSNPHFLLLPAAAFALPDWLRRGGLRPFAPVLAIVAGIIVGYTLHPQFPNTFLNWKIQCVDVPWQALTGGRIIALGTEFDKPGAVWFLKNAVSLMVFISNALLFARIAEKVDGESRLDTVRQMDPTALAMFAAATVAICATTLGMRAMEYAWPFVLLSLAANIAALKRDGLEFPRPFAGGRFPAAVKILVAVAACAFIVFQTENYARKTGMPPIADFAAYMARSGIPPGTVIANLAWSDYPFLIYSCPEYKYMSGMDPMFSYAFDPVKTLRLEKFRRGKLKLTPTELEDVVGAKYLFLRKMYSVYARKIRMFPCVTLYEGADGWLFKINGKIDKKTVNP